MFIRKYHLGISTMLLLFFLQASDCKTRFYCLLMDCKSRTMRPKVNEKSYLLLNINYNYITNYNSSNGVTKLYTHIKRKNILNPFLIRPSCFCSHLLQQQQQQQQRVNHLGIIKKVTKLALCSFRLKFIKLKISCRVCQVGIVSVTLTAIMDSSNF